MKGWNNYIQNDDMNRTEVVRRDRRALSFIGNVKNWQLLLVLLLAVMLAVIFLRLNSLGAIDRYNSLKSADESGDISKVEAAATELQNYTASHMNTAVPRLALQTLYKKAAQQALDAAKPADIDASLYQRVTEECASAWYRGGSRARGACIASKIGSSGASGYTEAETISPDAYYVQYAPARWSPDAAGFAVLACMILIFIIVVRLVSLITLKIILRFKYRAA